MNEKSEPNPYHGGEYPRVLARPVTETQRRAAGIRNDAPLKAAWGISEFDNLKLQRSEE